MGVGVVEEVAEEVLEELLAKVLEEVVVEVTEEADVCVDKEADCADEETGCVEVEVDVLEVDLELVGTGRLDEVAWMKAEDCGDVRELRLVVGDVVVCKDVVLKEDGCDADATIRELGVGKINGIACWDVAAAAADDGYKVYGGMTIGTKFGKLATDVLSELVSAVGIAEKPGSNEVVKPGGILNIEGPLNAVITEVAGGRSSGTGNSTGIDGIGSAVVGAGEAPARDDCENSEMVAIGLLPLDIAGMDT